MFMREQDFVAKEWGHEEIFLNVESGNYCCKRLVLNPGRRSSIHVHADKHETFIVEFGRVYVLASKTHPSTWPDLLEHGQILVPGDILVIEPGTWHVFWTDTPSSFFEVSTFDDQRDSQRFFMSGSIRDPEWIPYGQLWRRTPAGLNLLVVGDFMLDDYIDLTAGGAAQEAALTKYKTRGESVLPGGAAHVAALLAARGANVTAVGLVGGDWAGKQLCSLLESINVDTSLLCVHEDSQTLLRARFMDGDRIVNRVDSDHHISGDLISFALEEQLKANDGKEMYDAAFICDHGYGAMSDHMLGVVRASSKLLCVDPAPGGDWNKYAPGPLQGVLLKANDLEARRALQDANGQPAQWESDFTIKAFTSASRVTWSMLGKEHDQYVSSGAINLPGVNESAGRVTDVVGAGDEFFVMLALDLLCNVDAERAVRGAFEDCRRRVQHARRERWPWIAR